MKKADIGVALYLLAAVIFFIVPISSTLLDVMIAINISIALIILFNTLFVKEVLDMSFFPTLLLFTTIFRISLNVSSTRLILSTGAPGNVVTTFGQFVGGGDLVIGAIIFIVLIIIQFVVINKGSERVAEVTARFTLDAMPGKQMAIDADLNTGAITEKEARERRNKIQEESAFFGSMDADFGTVLVSQLFGIPKVLYLVGATLAFLGITTPLTWYLFVGLGLVFIISGRMMDKQIRVESIEEEVSEAETEAEEIRKPENVVSLLQVDPIELEFGYGIIPLADVNQGGDLLDRVVMIRRQIALELGTVVPIIRLRDNIQLNPNQYIIKIKGIQVTEGEILFDHYMAMNPGYVEEEITGIPTFDLNNILVRIQLDIITHSIGRCQSGWRPS